MAEIALTRENFVLHKLHSLSGIVPIGFYMVQHLTLNSFSIAGPAYFNAVIAFFDGIPSYLLLALEIFVIWIPLLFHAVYGVVIACRMQPNYIGTKYGWTQNRMFLLQRFSGLILFAFLTWHVYSTTIQKYRTGDSEMLRYAAWHNNLVSHGYILLVFYLVGIICATYHLSYGIWNFCIRWGITVSEESQIRVQKFSFVAFIALTVLGWGAILGFVIPRGGDSSGTVQTRAAVPSFAPRPA
jgi:succinate dehydrogenase / fumarate reductase cytochrome b subunit